MIVAAYEEDRKRVASIALLVTVVVHLCIFYFLLSGMRSARHPDIPVGTIQLFFILPNVPHLSQVPHALEESFHTATPPRKRAQTVTQKISAPHENLLPSVSSSSPEAVASASEVISGNATNDPPAIAAESILSSAKRNIGTIDSEYRAAFLKLPPPRSNAVADKLQRGIAKAARPTERTVETKTLADGRRVEKYSGPVGTFCFGTRSLGVTHGFDSFQGNGSRGTLPVRCEDFF